MWRCSSTQKKPSEYPVAKEYGLCRVALFEASSFVGRSKNPLSFSLATALSTASRLASWSLEVLRRCRRSAVAACACCSGGARGCGCALQTSAVLSHRAHFLCNSNPAIGTAIDFATLSGGERGVTIVMGGVRRLFVLWGRGVAAAPSPFSPVFLPICSLVPPFLRAFFLVIVVSHPPLTPFSPRR